MVRLVWYDFLVNHLKNLKYGDYLSAGMLLLGVGISAVSAVSTLALTLPPSATSSRSTLGAASASTLSIAVLPPIE